jgi:hypothetical protein
MLKNPEIQKFKEVIKSEEYCCPYQEITGDE